MLRGIGKQSAKSLSVITGSRCCQHSLLTCNEIQGIVRPGNRPEMVD